MDNPQAVHFTNQTASKSAMLTASTTKPQPSMPLSHTDRQLLILGEIGHYEWMCHDSHDDDDMTPSEHYDDLLQQSDAQLIENMGDGYTSPQDYYDSYSSYIPEEYSIH